MRKIAIYVFFFFQAEDGIRYRTLTGVQTCALPIYSAICCTTLFSSLFLCRQSSVIFFVGGRSEERRVGKECRSRWWPHHLKKKENDNRSVGRRRCYGAHSEGRPITRIAV